MKKIIFSLFILGCCSFTQFSSAETVKKPLPTKKTYSCTVLVIADDLKEVGEFHFTMDAVADESHGGSPKVFSIEKHQITVLTTGRWMAISWSRSGELLSETVTARSDDNAGSQVLIVYNPKNTNEQVSLGCDLKVVAAAK